MIISARSHAGRVAAGTTALLTACGSGASTTPVAPLAAPQVATSTAAAPSTVAPGTRPAPVADDDANVDADDQSGDGAAVAVRDVRLAGGPGWVVIRTDDDGRGLGAEAVGPGRSGPGTVTLSEPVPATDDDLMAALHLDDGDGAFDESRDPAVLDDGQDDADRDGDDVEDDDFDYRVA